MSLGFKRELKVVTDLNNPTEITLTFEKNVPIQGKSIICFKNLIAFNDYAQTVSEEVKLQKATEIVEYINKFKES